MTMSIYNPTPEELIACRAHDIHMYLCGADYRQHGKEWIIKQIKECAEKIILEADRIELQTKVSVFSKTKDKPVMYYPIITQEYHVRKHGNV